MKTALVVFFLLAELSSSVAAAKMEAQDRTITKVVKILQEMLDKSKEDGKADATIFGKYKCYCDTNTAEKTKSIEDLTKQIAMFEGQIEEYSASSGKLSTEVAALAKSKADNEASRADATEIRNKANADFVAEETDMTAAIGQMDNALETLSAVGADQTALAAMATEKSKFMEAGQVEAKKGVQVKQLSEKMRKALKAASVFLPTSQRKSLTGFIQAPFTGEYSSQSGEIVGILKSMRDTFKSNLGSARQTEASQLKAFNVFVETKTSEFNTMDSAASAKDEELGSNDGNLATAKESLANALATKAADEDFLASLTAMCASKTKEYEDRKMVRANEEAAVAQATSILNSDAAFDTFGASKATSEGATGFFLQMGKSSSVARAAAVRKQVNHILTKAARKHKSLGLAKVAAQVGKNPFKMVIKSISNQMKVIDEEETADDDKKAFCDDERTKNDENLAARKSNIETLEGEIASLTDEIENPETGLKAVLAEGQTNFKSTKDSQAEATSNRAAENGEYQKNIANLVEAEKIVEKATGVLSKFYDWLHAKQGPHHYEEKAGKDSGGATIKRIPEASVEELEEACSALPECVGFNTNGILKSGIAPEADWFDVAGSLYVKVFDGALLQQHKKEDPAPPADEFAESGKEKGGDVISMLTFILEETKVEEKTAHETEEKAQADYEDEMTSLKADEEEYLSVIASTEQSLAEKEKAKEESSLNLAATERNKKAIEKYLASIKPGCDFITENIDARKESRRAEKSALLNSKNLMEATPDYQSAAAEEEANALGECADVCMGEHGTDHVDCIICQDGGTKEGYCAANEGTPGC